MSSISSREAWINWPNFHAWSWVAPNASSASGMALPSPTIAAVPQLVTFGTWRICPVSVVLTVTLVWRIAEDRIMNSYSLRSKSDGTVVPPAVAVTSSRSRCSSRDRPWSRRSQDPFPSCTVWNLLKSTDQRRGIPGSALSQPRRNRLDSLLRSSWSCWGLRAPANWARCAA